MQLLPSTDAEQAIEMLDKLVAGRAAAQLTDEFFLQDWTVLWNEVAEAGWTCCADGATAGADGDFSLLDLTAVAETWGNYLIPLPLVPTLVARRWLDEKPPASTRLSYLVSETDTGLVSHGTQETHVMTGAGLKPLEATGPILEIDRFALSLPMCTIDTGAAVADPALRREAAILATSEAIGAASCALKLTVDYARIREQFGKPIGSFQAVKHILANAHIRIELSRSAIAWCCTDVAASVDATRAALGHCLRVAEDCVQAHGGVGFTWAAAPHRYYRHIMATRRLVAAALWNA
jgi:hypothetical protein